jgi:hypothetical protein
MTPRQQLRACVVANGFLTLLWIVAVVYFSRHGVSSSTYSMGNFMQLGPNKDLNVMGIVLETWSSYTCCARRRSHWTGPATSRCSRADGGGGVLPSHYPGQLSTQ